MGKRKSQIGRKIHRSGKGQKENLQTDIYSYKDVFALLTKIPILDGQFV